EIISNVGRGIDLSLSYSPVPNTRVIIRCNNISYNGTQPGGSDRLPVGLIIEAGSYVGELDARNNYWGPLSCPPGRPVSPNNVVVNQAFPLATVVYEPFLTSPPAC